MSADQWLIELNKIYEFIPCNQQFGASAGEPVRCTMIADHSENLKHFNHELKVSWW